jgi:hypothetical protein
MLVREEDTASLQQRIDVPFPVVPQYRVGADGHGVTMFPCLKFPCLESLEQEKNA